MTPGTEQELYRIINQIPPIDTSMLNRAHKHLDNLLKPPKSLGVLEEVASKLYAIRSGDTSPLSRRRVVVFCSDNGVVEEGIASAPQEVTAFMAESFTKGITGLCALAKAYWTDIKIVDVGIKTDVLHPLIENRKIIYGTKNFAKEKAMDKDVAVQTVIAGFQWSATAKRNGCQVLGIGEMGIGNTTTASAVLCALTGKKPANTSSKGAGLDDEGLTKKINIIDSALQKYALVGKAPLEIISAVGGLDIAAMTGAYLGAAYHSIPVVADGFISTVAALCAVRLCPHVKDYLFLSHFSQEKGYKVAMMELAMEPCLQLNMRLGEGSGCPIMFSVMDGALSVYNNMGTFSDGKISEEYIAKAKNPNAFKSTL